MGAGVTLVDFLRHGEPVGGRRYRGQADDPLSDKGWRQMREAVRHHHHWDVLVTSPLARCRAFADWLGAERRMPVRVEERFREVGFGEWEGKTPDELKAADPDRLFNFKRDPVGWRPAGAEALADFQRRVNAALDELLARHAGSHLLVVAHAGVIRMVAARVLGMPVEHAYRVQVGSAALARFRVEVKPPGAAGPGGRLEQMLFLTPGERAD